MKSESVVSSRKRKRRRDVKLRMRKGADAKRLKRKSASDSLSFWLLKRNERHRI